MNKYIFTAATAIFCVCGILAGCVEQRPAAIDNPAFEVWNNSTLEVAKIEMSDTATILHIHAFYQPNRWIRVSQETYIRPSGSAEKLVVARADSILLGEEFFMPESGMHSFTLYFPPLAKDVTKIDFLESDCSDCFKILGISLLPSAKIAEEPLPASVTATKDQPLPQEFFSNKKTRIYGKLLGYHKDLGIANISVYGGNMFEDADAVLPVAADGSFDGEIIANMPQMLHLSVGHRSVGVFVVPQEPQEIYIDLRKISRLEARLRKDKNPRDSTYVYTSGKYVDAKNLKKELTSFDGVMNNDSFLKKILNMPPQEYKDFLLDAMRRKQGALPANLPFNVDLLSKANIRLAIFNRIMGYERYQKLAYMQANDLNVTRYEKSGFTPAVPDLAYYSFLEDVIGNDMMYFSDFKQVVVRLSTAVALNLSAEHTAVERAEYFKAKTAPLLGPNREMLVDLVCAQIFSSQIQNAKFFTDEEKQQIRTHISNQEIAEAVIAVNDRVQAEVVEAEKRSASAIREVPAVSNEKLISAILNKYKGKTIVADIWATWCGPCRVANAEMKPVKEELRGKNVVFLYITGETSPLTAWHKMIPDIAGEHYRVSNAQWKYFTTSLGIQGIPTIMIFNKQGKQTYRETGFPGAAKVKQEILKNL